MSNGLDPDPGLGSSSLDLDQNCLQGLSADNKSGSLEGKSNYIYYIKYSY